MKPRPQARWIVALSASLLAAACSDPTDLGNSGARALGRVFSRPAWSADGHTIFFTDRAGAGITEIRVNALDVQTGRTRRLVAVNGLNHSEFVRTSADTAVVFVSIAKPDFSLQSIVYRIPTAGGQAEQLVDNVGVPRFVISSSGNHIAYQGSQSNADTIYVSTTSIPSVSVAMPTLGRIPNPISISADGARLLYWSTTGIYLADVHARVHQHLLPPLLVASGFDVPPVVWHGAVPHLLIAEVDSSGGPALISLYDIDAGSGNRTLLATIPLTVNRITSLQLARSQDGSIIAAWVPIAVTRQTVERTTFRFRLYIKRGPDAEMTGSFELESDQPLTWFEFSPDGSRIALLVKGSLYIVAVRSP